MQNKSLLFFRSFDRTNESVEEEEDEAEYMESLQSSKQVLVSIENVGSALEAIYSRNDNTIESLKYVAKISLSFPKTIKSIVNQEKAETIFSCVFIPELFESSLAVIRNFVKIKDYDISGSILHYILDTMPNADNKSKHLQIIRYHCEINKGNAANLIEDEIFEKLFSLSYQSITEQSSLLRLIRLLYSSPLSRSCQKLNSIIDRLLSFVAFNDFKLNQLTMEIFSNFVKWSKVARSQEVMSVVVPFALSFFEISNKKLILSSIVFFQSCAKCCELNWNEIISFFFSLLLVNSESSSFITPYVIMFLSTLITFQGSFNIIETFGSEEGISMLSRLGCIHKSYLMTMFTELFNASDISSLESFVRIDVFELITSLLETDISNIVVDKFLFVICSFIQNAPLTPSLTKLMIDVFSQVDFINVSCQLFPEYGAILNSVFDYDA